MAKPKPVVDAEARAEKQRLAREDRRLRQIALAQLIEDRIASGEFASLADAARRCGVSRARVSQVVRASNESALSSSISSTCVQGSKVTSVFVDTTDRMVYAI